MNCQRVRKRLVSFLAGECPPSEHKKITKHLVNCATCQMELEELRQVDLLLDLWVGETSPPDLKDGVLQVLREEARLNDQPKSFFYRFSRLAVLRDLIAAAVVSLVILWTGFSGPAVSNFDRAGKNINYAAEKYSQAVGDNLAMAAAVMQKYSSKILIEEWKSSEMYKPPGY